jgi:hypothetical protein
MAKVLHASGSGYFPNCIKQGSPPTSPSVDQYIPITLEEAMFIFWKGKDLKLSIAGYLINAPLPGAFKDTIDSKNQTFNRGIASESDLVCSNAANYSGIHIYSMPITYETTVADDPDYAPFPPGESDFLFSVGLATNPPNTFFETKILRNDSTYYARIRCSTNLNFSGASVGALGNYVVGQISISFGGENYSVPLRGNPDISAETIGQLNITAEWTSTYEYQD